MLKWRFIEATPSMKRLNIKVEVSRDDGTVHSVLEYRARAGMTFDQLVSEIDADVDELNSNANIEQLHRDVVAAMAPA